MTDTNLNLINKLISISTNYSDLEIESSVISYISNHSCVPFAYHGSFSKYKGQESPLLIEHFTNLNFPINIEFIIEYFEALLETNNKNENGIVFTPKYISDYICSDLIASDNNTLSDLTIIDPGCGCGIFLVSATEALCSKHNLSIRDALKSHVFGLELDPSNANRCQIVLNLYTILNGESNDNLVINIKCLDSLKVDWGTIFGINSFTYVIGNPPYVNTHDMSKETAKFLKDTFMTTKSGVYNIFYAFIEHGLTCLSTSGKLGFIIPNNFLTIKSAKALRELLSRNEYIEKIIDFADNMVFKPVRTYNCILELTKSQTPSFDYCVIGKAEDISATLKNLIFDKMSTNKLDTNGWKLVDKQTYSNLKKIEGQFRPIKEFVRTGIATLKDEVYIVDFDGKSYYKEYNGKRYTIDSSLAKKLYKIPDLKQRENIDSCCKYIIFPYQKGNSGFEIIPEDTMKSKYNSTYEYLLQRRTELDSRDKGNPKVPIWYAYGRTQGLNKYGKKLVFPTFAYKPRFIYIDDEYSLFCNGYAVFQNDYIDLTLLQNILNSEVMNYYVRNTSYSIEGEYYCYQKKYIENFSLPFFTQDEQSKMKLMNKDELDAFLFLKYNLTF